jgi:hypothetical protein
MVVAATAATPYATCCGCTGDRMVVLETRVGFGSSTNEGGLGVEEEEETETEPRRESSSQ